MHSLARPESAFFFLTAALVDRGSDVLLREFQRLRQAVRLTRLERPFAIAAWVVLPDHLHAIWTMPAGDSDVSSRWRLIKARFAAALPRRLAFDRCGLWQAGLDLLRIRSGADLARQLRFCQTDPVKHGLVDDPADWRYSSFQRPAPQQRAG